MHTLRTFETLGRLRSFARTAGELYLTASAVSHQIQALESFYATKLFQRTRRDVLLTPAGERLLEVVRSMLQQLSLAGESLKVRDPYRLSVTAPPSLVSRWLMPRLSVFLRQHPEIAFKLHATTAIVNLDMEEADFGIRFGKGRWIGLHSKKLFDEEIFPVASPDYVSQMKVRQLADMKRCILLQDDFQTWADWFTKVGLEAAETKHGPFFSDSSLLLQAAEAGQGIALARSVLVVDAITAGALVRIGKSAVPASGSYYLVSPTHQSDSTSAIAFRLWLSKVAME